MSKKFHRREFHKRKKLSMAWRKPKGMHSKVRRKEKKTFKMPDPSFMKPKNQRFKHPSGLEQIIINSKKQFKKIIEEKKDTLNNYIFVLNSKLSKKTIKEILENALKLKIRIANTKKIEKKLEKIQKEIKERKKKSEQRKNKKKERMKKAKEKAEKEKAKTGKPEIKQEQKEITEEKQSINKIKKTTRTTKETKSFKGDSNRGR